MLADFELVEIDRLNKAIEREREWLCSLVEMLGVLGVRVWFDEAGEITVINRALEAPCPAGVWPWCRMWGTDNIGLGAGYMGLGAGGT